jgi:hypothetical protein
MERVPGLHKDVIKDNLDRLMSPVAKKEYLNVQAMSPAAKKAYLDKNKISDLTDEIQKVRAANANRRGWTNKAKKWAADSVGVETAPKKVNVLKSALKRTITKKDRTQLYKLGYNESDISNMSPSTAKQTIDRRYHKTTTKQLDNAYAKSPLKLSSGGVIPKFEAGGMPDFSEKLPLWNDYGNRAVKYHQIGEDIYANRTRQKALLDEALESGKDSSKLRKEYEAGNIALDKVRKILAVNQRGGDIYDDPSLQKKVMVSPIASPYNFGKDSPWKFIQRDEARFTSVLDDVRKAGVNARSGMFPKSGEAAKINTVTKAQPPSPSPSVELANTSNAMTNRGAGTGFNTPSGENDFQKFSSNYGKDAIARIRDIVNSASAMSATSPELVAMKAFLKNVDLDMGGAPKLANGGSMPVKHFGGVVTQTGPIFAQKGEYVVPKGFRDGTSGLGAVPSGPAASALTSGAIKLDGSEILSQLNSLSLKVDNTPLKVDATPLSIDTSSLESLQLKVDSTPLPVEVGGVKLDVNDVDSKLSSAIKEAISSAALLKVEDKVFTVEDKMLTVEDKVFTVEDKQFTIEDKVFTVEDKQFTVEDKVFTVEDKQFTIEDKVFTVEDKQFTIEDKVFTVEDKQFTVEDKVFTVEDKQFTVTSDGLTLDTSGAESRLASAISDAINNAVVNIKLESPTTGGSVGADKFDQLAQTVSDVNDKLISNSVIMDDKVRVLEGDIDLTVDTSVERKLASKLININDGVQSALSTVDSLTNNVTSQISRIQSEVDETKYLANMALNARGTGNLT